MTRAHCGYTQLDLFGSHVFVESLLRARRIPSPKAFLSSLKSVVEKGFRLAKSISLVGLPLFDHVAERVWNSFNEWRLISLHRFGYSYREISEIMSDGDSWPSRGSICTKVARLKRSGVLGSRLKINSNCSKSKNRSGSKKTVEVVFDCNEPFDPMRSPSQDWVLSDVPDLQTEKMSKMDGSPTCRFIKNDGEWCSNVSYRRSYCKKCYPFVYNSRKSD